MTRRRNAPLKGARSIGSNMTEVEHGDLTILYSYETPVAFLSPRGGYRTEKQWSKTTSTHIGKFFRRHGYDLKGAFKIPQDDLARFVESGSLGQGDFPITLIGDPEHPERQRQAVRRLTRGNPRKKKQVYVYTDEDIGQWIDGAFGDEHAVNKMQDMLGDVVDATKGKGYAGATGDLLLAELEDEWEGEDFDVQEWLDDATDVLQRVTASDLTWEWDAGDLVLVQEVERER